MTSGEAWVSDGARIYFARGNLAPNAPFSPITELIQGVYRLHRENARKILRGRIYTDFAPTPMCLGAVKVAAKRVSYNPDVTPPKLPRTDVTMWPRYEAPSVAEILRLPLVATPSLVNAKISLTTNDHARFMNLAQHLAKMPESAATLPRYARDRAVGAVLISREGELLAGARNAGALSRALHAEVNLVQSWYRSTGRGLPAGSRIYVTLKCCRMCAAMIWQSAEAVRSLAVYYDEDDPGPHARATALDPGSFDRSRAVGGDPELLQIETQFSLKRDHKRAFTASLVVNHSE